MLQLIDILNQSRPEPFQNDGGGAWLEHVEKG